MTYKDIFRGLGFLTMVLSGLKSCQSPYDVYPYLVQKCQAGDTLNIKGVPVARTTARLKSGEEIVAGRFLGYENTVTNLGGGAFSVSPELTPENLPDGRVILHQLSPFQPDIRIALTKKGQGDELIFEFALNCKDTTAIPPVEE
ncbi:hypothetical protein A2872_01615 [Candidatus Gottesmanbacteria bacterium RIFCSPHIGHO2_01_FULL_42_12]|uniref:Uncharacterized protein n=1 Tax=Candidatus Gottesmanbacteria bacterium RIFCSPHIGHO2_01_FULL_42_12 TaxID=1798377 RepID=A0A1F5Z4J4_9BACT|nr:MAG: hypothetical protein A2872_01615 [Candidatus Gottesmanbacteria bacterium RIFCSPHIGHO2_01_FULL_42_12]